MKKSVIIITALIYLLSIVIVAFLGYQAEIHNPPIMAETIVLKYDDENWPELPYMYKENGGEIYEVRYNPEFNPESEVLLNRYPYIIDIKDFDYLYSEHGKLQLTAEPYSSKGEVSEKDLSYYIDKNKSKYITVDEGGLVSFNEESTYGSYEVLISAKDGSGVKITVFIRW